MLLYETAHAFKEKRPLLRDVLRLLKPGGRFALTLEAGDPLSPAERRSIPGGETVWPVREEDFASLLRANGLRLLRTWERTASHADVARRLCDALLRRRGEIPAAHCGAMDRLIEAHERRWAEWLFERRVRKLAVVTERPAS